MQQDLLEHVVSFIENSVDLELFQQMSLIAYISVLDVVVRTTYHIYRTHVGYVAYNRLIDKPGFYTENADLVTYRLSIIQHLNGHGATLFWAPNDTSAYAIRHKSMILLPFFDLVVFELHGEPAGPVLVMNIFSSIPVLTTVRFRNMLSYTKIGDGFFSSCRSLKSIDTTGLLRITEIGDKFLLLCDEFKNAEQIHFPRLRKIGSSFMNGCHAIETFNTATLTMQDITEIGHRFFTVCKNIHSIDLIRLRKIKSLGHRFLHGSIAIKSIDLSICGQLQDIGDQFADGCFELKSVFFPSHTEPTTIGNNVLAYCPKLEHINISVLKNLNSIGNDFLIGATSLQMLSMSNLSHLHTIGIRFCVNSGRRVIIDMYKLERLRAVGDGFATYLGNPGVVTILTSKDEQSPFMRHTLSLRAVGRTVQIVRHD